MTSLFLLDVYARTLTWKGHLPIYMVQCLSDAAQVDPSFEWNQLANVNEKKLTFTQKNMTPKL